MWTAQIGLDSNGAAWACENLILASALNFLTSKSHFYSCNESNAIAPHQ